MSKMLRDVWPAMNSLSHLILLLVHMRMHAEEPCGKRVNTCQLDNCKQLIRTVRALAVAYMYSQPGKYILIS